MIKKSTSMILILLMVITASPFVAMSQPVKKKADKKIEKNIKKKDITKKDDKKDKAPAGLQRKLTLNKEVVIQYLINNNYDVKKALLDYQAANSAQKQYEAKYDWIIFGSGGYGYTGVPNSGTQPLYGKGTHGVSYAAGINKMFSSGTSLSATFSGVFQRKNFDGVAVSAFASAMGPITDLHQTGLSVEVQQELLKNFIGINDRMTQKKLKNITKMNKQMIKLQLAQLLTNGLIAYWQVAVAEKGLVTAKQTLRSTQNIRALIGRKLGLGLAEREDISDWNGKLMQGRNMLLLQEKSLMDAKMAVKRTLNIKSNTKIILSDVFYTKAPKVTVAQAMKDAFKRRVDWNNQKLALKNAYFDYKMAFQENLPSLKLKVGVGLNGSRNSPDNVAHTFIDWFNFGGANQDYKVSLELSYPLGNSGAEAKIKDARIAIAKQKIQVKVLQNNIRDEIISAVKQCEVNFKVYEQTKLARIYAQNYYYQVYRKFRRGRYSATQLKLAQDAWVQSQHSELKSLVDYNMALIKRDLARYTIFESFGIDLDKLLKKYEKSLKKGRMPKNLTSSK